MKYYWMSFPKISLLNPRKKILASSGKVNVISCLWVINLMF